MFDWIASNQGIVWAFVAASAVIFVASLVVMPAIVARLPADYFAHDVRPPSRWAGQHPLVRAALLVGKNILGGVFVLAGIAMLVLPGQGLLTLMIGFVMLDFPGKYRVEKWLIRRRYVLRPINWLRRRAGQPRLHL